MGTYFSFSCFDNHSPRSSGLRLPLVLGRVGTLVPLAQFCFSPRRVPHSGEQYLFRTIAIVSVCLGLRISECLGLKWSDVNWLDGTITVERGIVNQNVDDVKSAESRKQLSLDGGLLEVLKAWRSMSQLTAPGDWMFASPAQLGRLPWSYDGV